jgi:hypothetical protein
MKKIEDFYEHSKNLDLTESEKCSISETVRKYEKYCNLYDTKNFNESLDCIVDDISNKLGIDKSKNESLKSHLMEIYSLSEGLSIVMAPWPMIQSNVIDQVQHFQC